MREVFKNAILNNAVTIIVFYNHPSGDSTPSNDNLNVSRKLKQ